MNFLTISSIVISLLLIGFGIEFFIKLNKNKDKKIEEIKKTLIFRLNIIITLTIILSIIVIINIVLKAI